MVAPADNDTDRQEALFWGPMRK